MVKLGGIMNISFLMGLAVGNFFIDHSYGCQKVNAANNVSCQGRYSVAWSLTQAVEQHCLDGNMADS